MIEPKGCNCLDSLNIPYKEIFNRGLDKYQSCKLSPSAHTHAHKHTVDFHLSLQAKAGSGHGQVSDKSEGTEISGRSERCRRLL